MVTRKELVDLIRARIEAGEFKPGERLPTTDQLTRDYQVSESTVYNAMEILRAMGIVRGQQGEARYVAAPGEEPSGDITVVQTPEEGSTAPEAPSE